MVLKISLCLLAFVINISTSSEYTGLLSRLYQKATSENRPLVLVLDNSLKQVEDASRDLKSAGDQDEDPEQVVPSNLLDIINQKRLPLKFEHKHVLFDSSAPEQREVEANYQHSDLQNLGNRLKKHREQDRKDRRERRDRKRERNNEQDRDDDRNQRLDRNQDRQRERQQRLNRYQDRSQYRNQNRNQNRNRNQNQFRSLDKQRNNDKRALRSSVIKNLLRTFNDINCEAKDECADTCSNKYNGKKRDTCENKCEVKYECEESEPEDDPCENDECADSDEPASTKGERLVTVTPKCKRC